MFFIKWYFIKLLGRLLLSKYVFFIIINVKNFYYLYILFDMKKCIVCILLKFEKNLRFWSVYEECYIELFCYRFFFKVFKEWCVKNGKWIMDIEV